MKTGVRKAKRRNKGLKMLLGGILAVFAVILVAVTVKMALSGFGGSGKGETKKSEDKNKVLVTGVEVTCDRPVVRAGEELPLDVKVTPENATDSSLTWTVSGDMGTVSKDDVFTPSLEAGKSDVELTATANDGTKIFASITIRVLEAIDPSKPMVAITYDDGPNAKTTPKVLDVLEQKYAVATFFMVGQNIEGKEDIIRRSYEMGNEMGNHTWDHTNLSKVGADTIRSKIEDTNAAIQAICNVESPILRPPYGAYNSTVKETVGTPIVLWSLDTLDWSTRSADATYDACMEAKDGDIILMHDIHESTVVAAEDIVAGLQEKGFQLVTVSELYHYRQGEFGPGTVNFKMTLDEYKKILEKIEETSTEETMDPTSSSADPETSTTDGVTGEEVPAGN